MLHVFGIRHCTFTCSHKLTKSQSDLANGTRNGTNKEKVKKTDCLEETVPVIVRGASQEEVNYDEKE